MKPLLSGKTAIITGASKGIGLACAQLFWQEGANVMHILYLASDMGKAVTGRVLVVDTGAYIGA